MDSSSDLAGLNENLGTTSTGQETNYVFNLALGGTPTIQYQMNGNQFVIFWATNTPGYSLQTSTNLFNTNLYDPGGWTTLPGPFSQTNGVYALTNTASLSRCFYRLAN